MAAPLMATRSACRNRRNSSRWAHGPSMRKLAVMVSSSNGLDYLLMLQRYIATVLEDNHQFSRFTGYRCRVRPSGDRRTPATCRGCPSPASCTSAAWLLLRPEERPERKPVQYGLGLLDR